MKLRAALLGMAGLGLVAGCAHAPRPDEQLGQSEAALRSANELGAKRIPPAALEVQLAEEEVQHARDLMKNDDNEAAKLQLMRARADAELAVALARQSQAEGAERSAKDQLQSLQQQAAPVQQ